MRLELTLNITMNEVLTAASRSDLLMLVQGMGTIGPTFRCLIQLGEKMTPLAAEANIPWLS